MTASNAPRRVQSAFALALICVVSLVVGAHRAPGGSTKRDAPAERGWWVFQQRAYPLRHIPGEKGDRLLFGSQVTDSA